MRSINVVDKVINPNDNDLGWQEPDLGPMLKTSRIKYTVKLWR